MKHVLFAALLFALARATAATLPGDAAEGKRLHDANCTGCHDAHVYTRLDHRVRTLDALQAQLGSCSHAANKDFTAAQTQSLVKYLNDQFYRFK